MSVDYEDSITLSTPEGIELELSLAGAGSRAIAGAIDLFVRFVLLGALAVALAAAGALGLAAFSIASFLVLFAYDVPFEVLGRGRTPGKRMCRLRVVRSDGGPVDLQSSAVRNIARLIDGPPLFYLPTVVGILATRHNQRPGDLAADTVVIRTAGRRPAEPAREVPVSALDWDVSAIGPDELAVVRRFLERRDGLTPEARRALALRLADGLRPRVSGAAGADSPEGFLETLLATKDARSGRLASPPQPP
jgi:uncharacterized RDD family membrane protein YckC